LNGSFVGQGVEAGLLAAHLIRFPAD